MSDTLRDRIAVALADADGPSYKPSNLWWEMSDAVLTLPEVRDALAAQERVTDALALAFQWCGSDNPSVAATARGLRRALTGES